MVIAAGYALPLTADINGVMPLASLGNKLTSMSKRMNFFLSSLQVKTATRYANTRRIIDNVKIAKKHTGYPLIIF